MSRRKLLLENIKLLGGDKTDLDLIQEVLSDGEGDDNLKDPVKRTVVDESTLTKDLQAFYNQLGIAGMGTVESEEEEEIPAKKLSAKEKKKLKKDLQKSLEPVKPSVDLSLISEEFLRDEDEEENSFALDKGQEDSVRDMVGQLLSGNIPTETKSLIFEMDENLWYQTKLDSILPQKNQVKSMEKVKEAYCRAEMLWKSDVLKYDQKQANESKANKDFVSTILKSGTVTDKVSALTLLIQQSPVHAFSYLSENLINGMARKKARREAILAVDSIKDLMINNVLPDRKLKAFVDQPCIGKNVTPKHLLLWYYEDSLKKAYFAFIQILEVAFYIIQELSKDSLNHVKNKALSCAFELLCAKPEEEENLLSLLVNKMGDLDKKIASKATHLLSQLLMQHPAMKLVVVTEVERLLLRPNVADRARYYAITFLNQIVLNKSAECIAIANKLIQIYFTVFSSLVKTLKSETTPHKPELKNPRKEKSAGALNNIDSLNFKMMAALLTGVNRAYPFAELESAVFEAHLDTLFKISHLSSFNTSIQALSLIFQVQSQNSLISSRFYRTLYDSLFDRRLFDTSKQAMYLNLLYRSLKADSSNTRITSFIKRLVQICSVSDVPLICGSLFLISELLSHKPELWSIVSKVEDEDEHFVDADQESLVNATRKESESVHKGYDGRKRDPLFSNAEKSSLWDLSVLVNHFHPTVSLYAKTILSRAALSVPSGATNYDPLLNHTLSRFLERFVYKAPKKVKSIHHGSSLMQPRGFSNQLVSGGKRKSNSVLNDEDGAVIQLDDAPVNAMNWKKEDQVPADEVFFYKFFADKTKRNNNTLVEKNEDLNEDSIWAAMSKSVGLDEFSDEDSASDLGEIFDEESDGDESDDAGSEREDDDLFIDGEDDDEISDEDSSVDESTVVQSEKEKKSKIPRRLQKFSKIASELGYKGDYFATQSGDFAAADDFEDLIDDDISIKESGTNKKRPATEIISSLKKPKKSR